MYKAAAPRDFATRRSRAHGSRRTLPAFYCAIRDGGSGSHGPNVVRGSSYELWFLAEGRFEERFLRIELGRESYAAYCRVPMLVPFITAGEGSSRRPRANQ